MYSSVGYHYQHSGERGTIGLQLLASGEYACLHSKSVATTCQLTFAHSGCARTSPSPSPSTSTRSQPWHFPQDFGQSQYAQSDEVNSRPSPAQEHVPALPPDPPCKLLSDYMLDLSTDDPQCINVISTPSSPCQEHVPTAPTPDNLAPNSMHELLTDDQQHITTVGTSLSPTREHIPISAPALQDKPTSDQMYELSTEDQQYLKATSAPSSFTREHVPTSQLSPLRILTSPDKLHATLLCWIKNMNKLSSLIDRLHELASSAPAEHRSQLSDQVAALRATSEKQQEHYMEFLQLSEEYANRYLLDISAEIEQQSSFLDKLEGRLETAKKLREEVVDLQTLYVSGTVAAMQDLRAKGKAASCRSQRQNIDFDFSTSAAVSRGPRTVP